MRSITKAAVRVARDALSAFSRHKRRLGSALITRGGDATRRVEPMLRVLTHDLTLLAVAA